MNSLLRGAIDLHVHCSPDVVLRAQDFVDLARAAKAAGMAGVGLKDHTTSTVGRCHALNRRYPDGPRFYSSIALNTPVGGINPAAAEAALLSGADIVYFPTYSARHHIETLGLEVTPVPHPTGGFEPLTVFNDGKLTDSSLAIINMIAEHDAVLATGHISPHESLALLDADRRHGVKRMIVTHASEIVPSMSVDDQFPSSRPHRLAANRSSEYRLLRSQSLTKASNSASTRSRKRATSTRCLSTRRRITWGRKDRIPGYEKVQTVDHEGQPGHGPCWNHPAYREWVYTTIRELVSNYRLDGLQYGAERTGPLSHVLFRGVTPTCFCQFYRSAISYGEMAENADFIKPIVYHEPMGPRLRWWVLERMKERVLNELTLEQSLDLFYSLFGHDSEKQPKLDELEEAGLGPEYVYRETRRCKQSVGDQAKVYAGIGIDVPWYVEDGMERRPSDPEQLEEAVQRAFAAGADGVLASREYNEMRLSGLEAFARGVRDR